MKYFSKHTTQERSGIINSSMKKAICFVWRMQRVIFQDSCKQILMISIFNGGCHLTASSPWRFRCLLKRRPIALTPTFHGIIFSFTIHVKSTGGKDDKQLVFLTTSIVDLEFQVFNLYWIMIRLAKPLLSSLACIRLRGPFKTRTLVFQILINE